MPQSIEMTRQQLYDLVWSRSMGDAAASIPMAHVTLKKLCVKHQVPVPPQGHWKKSSPRQAADKVPLPLTMGEQRIWVKRFVQWRPTDSRLRDRVNATFSLEEASPSENTAHWHGCTKRTKSALAQATPDRRGALETKGVGLASVRVAPETVPRTLAVLDHLIRAEGGWTHRPTGKLTIILSNGYEHGLPSRWADGASHPVESRVDEVAAAAVAHAQAITVRHQRIEARTAERREAEQQVQQRDQQSRRISFFKERADMLDEVARFDRFLQHIRETNDYPSVKMHEFLKGAQAYISGFRQRCNAAAIDDELTGNELW
jgi:hypothetical protein